VCDTGTSLVPGSGLYRTIARRSAGKQCGLHTSLYGTATGHVCEVHVDSNGACGSRLQFRLIAETCDSYGPLSGRQPVWVGL
jgi:hypothetical protein